MKKNRNDRISADTQQENTIRKRFLSDSHFRIRMTGAMSGGFDIVYAVFNLLTAGAEHSFWFLTLGVYYAVLGLMRASAVAFQKEEDRKAGQRFLLRKGTGLLVVSIVFAGMAVLTISEGRNENRGTVFMIAMAAFSFTLVTLAVINMIRVRNSVSLQKIVLRNLSMASAVVSIFSLERSMLGTFGTGGDYYGIMEALSGAGTFLIVAGLGIHLIRKAAGWKEENSYSKVK